jgi:hypothetical protein
MRELQQRNPERHKGYQKKSIQKLYQLRDELKSKPCADCSESYPPYVMDFDHKSGKEFCIAKCAGRVSRRRLLKEAAKCDVVCANCHRERTHQRRTSS